MNRWPLLAVVSVLAVLAGAYAYYARHGRLRAGNLRAAEAELNVEDFESEEVSDVDAEAESLPESESQTIRSQSAAALRLSSPRSSSHAAGEIETIDDEDTMGETVEEPLLIEDDDEQGTLEVIQPPAVGP